MSVRNHFLAYRSALYHSGGCSPSDLWAQGKVPIAQFHLLQGQALDTRGRSRRLSVRTSTSKPQSAQCRNVSPAKSGRCRCERCESDEVCFVVYAKPIMPCNKGYTSVRRTCGTLNTSNAVCRMSRRTGVGAAHLWYAASGRTMPR